MTFLDLLRLMLSRKEPMRKEIADCCSIPGNRLKYAVNRSGLTCSETNTAAAALMINQNFTDRTVQFLRSYLTTKIPSVKEGTLSANFAFHCQRSVILSVKDSVQNYLTALNNVGRWPYPP